MKTLTQFILCLMLSIGMTSIAQNDLTSAQWQEDLRYLQTTVHNDFPSLFKKVTAETFDKEIDKLYSEIPSLEAHELPVAFARIVSLFQYGHTQITFGTVAKSGVLPVNLYHFNDGVYIEGVHKDHQKTLGAKVLKIGDKSIEKALELIYPVVPVENSQYFKAYGLRFLTVPDVLHTQRVISKRTDEVTLTLEKEGATFEYTFPKIPLKDKPRYFNFTLPTENWLTARNTSITPLYLKHLGDKLYYFEYLEDAKTLYVRQSSVFNDDSETLKDFYKRLFTFIDSNAIDKLIYDVRLNGGGNNYNNLPFIKGIMARPEINTKGKFFFIIGRDTFSACQNLTNEVTTYTEAIIVGEPTGENVNFFGDTRAVTLKNSKLKAYLSFAWWQDKPQWEGRDSTLPHIAADISFKQYINNEDPVFDAAFKYTDTGFILDPMQHLTELFIAGKYEEVKSEGAKIAHNPEYRYYDFEEEFSKAGNRLLGSGDATAQKSGLFILQLVSELYPESISALYSLANAQELNKLNDKAIESYKKIIALDPDGNLVNVSQNRIKALKGN